MAMISFSVFKEKIEDGSKRHTIRFRLNPPRVGEVLYLWWKSRTPDREFLGAAVCTKVESIFVDPSDRLVKIDGEPLSLSSVEALAFADGFDSVEAFWLFFPEAALGWLIHWNPDHVTRRSLLPDVFAHGGFTADVISQPAIAQGFKSDALAFNDHWCKSCDRRKGCFIFQSAVIGDLSNQLIRHEQKTTCLVFKPKKRSIKPAVVGQGVLF